MTGTLVSLAVACLLWSVLFRTVPVKVRPSVNRMMVLVTGMLAAGLLLGAVG